MIKLKKTTAKRKASNRRAGGPGKDIIIKALKEDIDASRKELSRLNIEIKELRQTSEKSKDNAVLLSKSLNIMQAMRPDEYQWIIDLFRLAGFNFEDDPGEDETFSWTFQGEPVAFDKASTAVKTHSIEMKIPKTTGEHDA